MPFPLKIRPIDANGAAIASEVSKSAHASKFRLRKLFERQFSTRCSSAEKSYGEVKEKDPASDFEPSSLCLAGMVQNFMESGPNERPPSRCAGRLCFNANSDDLSDDDFDFADFFPASNSSSSAVDPIDLLKVISIDKILLFKVSNYCWMTG